MTGITKILIEEFLIKGLIIAVIGGIITTYLNENIKLLRTSFLIASATRKIQTKKPKTIKRGVNILVQIATDLPYRRQEMINIIINECIRKKFRRQENPPVTSSEMVEVFIDSLNSILNIPRENENRHRLDINLHQIALVAEKGNSIYLENMDFRDVVLWGSEFVNVDFSRSNFENSDLGGVLFKHCGLEDLNLKNAKMSFSFLDPRRPTMLINSYAARTTIDEALIITVNQIQLVITNTEIDLEKREKLKQQTPMVRLDNY
ncbi:MAG: pentapeptide repeat-containing protein [Pseudanabaena sp.]